MYICKYVCIYTNMYVCIYIQIMLNQSLEEDWKISQGKAEGGAEKMGRCLMCKYALHSRR